MSRNNASSCSCSCSPSMAWAVGGMPYLAWWKVPWDENLTGRHIGELLKGSKTRPLSCMAHSSWPANTDEQGTRSGKLCSGDIRFHSRSSRFVSRLDLDSLGQSLDRIHFHCTRKLHHSKRIPFGATKSVCLITPHVLTATSLELSPVLSHPHHLSILKQTIWHHSGLSSMPISLP